MFSPDTFYNILNSYYGYPKTNNIIFYPTTHGEKDLFKFGLYTYTGDCCPTKNLDQLLFNKIVLHDQEVLSNYSVYTYKDFFATQEKTNSYYTIPTGYIAARVSKTIKTSIWCHSELNSNDINELKDWLFTDCYYWYHGMISKDWFRHWQWHGDLKIKNRADAPYRFILYARGKDGTREYRNLLIKDLSSIKDSIWFDWDERNAVPSDFSATIDVNDANSTAIHIVAETLFDTSKIHLTEKVFKPMVMCQPFILVSSAGSLKYLQNYGFKTFESVWDESYDLITDPSERLASIIKLITNLNQIPQNKFSELYKKILPILDFNRKRFYSSEFQDYLLGEMFQNFDLALKHQALLDVGNPGGQWALTINFNLEQGMHVDMIKHFFPMWNVCDAPLKEKILKKYPLIKKLINS